MENIGRRDLFRLLFAAGTVATLGSLATGDDAMAASSGGKSAATAADASGLVETVESGMQPTQAVVIRPDRRHGGRVIVRPRRPRRRRRPRRVCRRTRRGRLVCHNVW